MKRLCTFLLAFVLLAGLAPALAYNSFTDDGGNAGIYDNFAWNGEYAYWLNRPQEDWTDVPANLYRMRPGGDAAELLLEGGPDRWIHSLLNIGDCLLLAVSEGMDAQLHPALVNFDGSGYRVLDGNIGSFVLGDGAVYNSVDGGVYRVKLDDMTPRRIYEYPEEIWKQAPELRQWADGALYFSTREPAWYMLDTGRGEAKRIASVRGDGFVLDGMLYIADYDALDGTWKYDVDTGNRAKASDRTYNFKQGAGNLVRATGDDPDSWFQGAVFDLTKLPDGLDAARTAECDENYDVLLGGGVIHYDWQNNRVDWADGFLPDLSVR